MMKKILNVVDDNKDDISDITVDSCVLAAVDDNKDNIKHNKENINQMKALLLCK